MQIKTAGDGRSQRNGAQYLRRSRVSFAVLAALSMVLSVGVRAQSLEAQAAAGAAAPTQNTVINLINLLVKQGVITQANAQGLIREAQAETEQAKAAATQAGMDRARPRPFYRQLRHRDWRGEL